MNTTNKKIRLAAILALSCFALWTLLVSTVDLAPIGPLDSKVGFASLNGAFHSLTGVHLPLYVATDWMGLVPFAVAGTFAVLGAIQWIRRKSLWRVDVDLLTLGVFYAAVIAVYLFFEVAVINRRPVLIEGVLEASYPSSTTVLVICVMLTACMIFHRRIQNKCLDRMVCAAILAFSAFMVTGRLLSGVHWITDIIGGILLSAGLVTLYRFFSHLK